MQDTRDINGVVLDVSVRHVSVGWSMRLEAHLLRDASISHEAVKE